MIDDQWRSLGMNTSKKFEIGDLVSWKVLGSGKKKDFGIIVEIYKSKTGGRNIVYAKVVSFSDNSSISLPIMNLRQVSKKEANEVYYKMYKEAIKRAKIARDLALSSYLEAKNIKNKYMLDEALLESDDDSDLEKELEEE